MLLVCSIIVKSLGCFFNNVYQLVLCVRSQSSTRLFEYFVFNYLLIAVYQLSFCFDKFFSLIGFLFLWLFNEVSFFILFKKPLKIKDDILHCHYLTWPKLYTPLPQSIKANYFISSWRKWKNINTNKDKSNAMQPTMLIQIIEHGIELETTLYISYSL